MKINKTNVLMKIKSKLILKKLFLNLKREKFLKIIRHNKEIQLKLDIDIEDYKDYSPIELELISLRNIYHTCINIPDIEEKKYFHISQIDDYEVKKNEDETKIKIIIIFDIQ